MTFKLRPEYYETARQRGGGKASEAGLMEDKVREKKKKNTH